jgi:hypothetical protein
MSDLQPFHEQLQPAEYRGVKFFTTGGRLRFGRRNATHEYPFRDTIWVEDLGRSARRIQMTGFLVGDAVIQDRAGLMKAAETPGEGELIHPTLGRLTVSLMDVETSESFDSGRVIELVLTFVEQGQRQYPDASSSTAAATVAAAGVGDTSSVADWQADAAGNLASPAAAGAVSDVSSGFGDAATQAGQSATALVRMTAVLPVAAGGLIRGGTGILSGQVVIGASGLGVQDLIGLAAAGRQTIAAAVGNLASAASNITAATVGAFGLAVHAVTETIRAAAATPGDAIRALTQLAEFNPLPQVTGPALTVHIASVTLVRRTVVVAVAARRGRSTSRRRATTRSHCGHVVLDLVNREIDAAGDTGADDVYVAMRAMRVGRRDRAAERRRRRAAHADGRLDGAIRAVPGPRAAAVPRRWTRR